LEIANASAFRVLNFTNADFLSPLSFTSLAAQEKPQDKPFHREALLALPLGFVPPPAPSTLSFGKILAQTKPGLLSRKSSGSPRDQGDCREQQQATTPRITQTQNHTAWFGLEETLQIIWFQPPCQGRDPFHQPRLLRAPSSLASLLSACEMS